MFNGLNTYHRVTIIQCNEQTNIEYNGPCYYDKLPLNKMVSDGKRDVFTYYFIDKIDAITFIEREKIENGTL